MRSGEIKYRRFIVDVHAIFRRHIYINDAGSFKMKSGIRFRTESY